MKLKRNYYINGEVVTRKTFFEFLKICAKHEWVKVTPVIMFNLKTIMIL